MTFANPWVLLGLVVPLALLVFTWLRQGRRLALPFDHGRQPRRRGLAAILHVFESAPSFLLAVAVMLLAGPQKTGVPKVERERTNIQFCVDRSGSMAGKFGEGTRYTEAMKAIDEFLDFREGDSFGLTFYGNQFVHWVPLTSDTSAIRYAPPFMDPSKGNLPGFNGTEIGRALLGCREKLNEIEGGDKMIVLFSDGISLDLNNGRDREIATKLEDDGIVVYAVHIAEGTLPDEVVNVAIWTGGEWFQPGDPEALKRAFARIDDLEKAKLKPAAGELVDDFAILAWVALGWLTMLVVGAFGLRYTPW